MKRAWMVLVVAAVAVGLVASPASAQTKTRKDKVGDATSNVDIRSAKVQNNARSYGLTVRFQTVQKRRTAVAVSLFPGGRLDPETNSVFYGVLSEPISGGRYTAQLFRISVDEADDEVGEQRVACPGLTSRWQRGTRGFARIVVPQSCLGADAGTLAAAVLSFDKRAIDARLALRETAGARRGDLTDDDIPVDFIASPITTRRG